MKVGICGIQFELKPIFMTKGKKDFGDTELRNKYVIIVEKENSSISFEYWDSVKNTTEGKRLDKVLTYQNGLIAKANEEWENNILNAFYCFISAAIAYINNNNMVDFIEHFSFTDIRYGIKVFEKCKSNYYGCLELGLVDDSIRNIYDELGTNL